MPNEPTVTIRPSCGSGNPGLRGAWTLTDAQWLQVIKDHEPPGDYMTGRAVYAGSRRGSMGFKDRLQVDRELRRMKKAYWQREWRRARP